MENKLLEFFKMYQKRIDRIDQNEIIYFQNFENDSIDFSSYSLNSITLDLDSHKYYFNYNGNSFPINDDYAISATNYIKHYDDRFNYDLLDIPKEKLQKSADDGIRIHAAIEKRDSETMEKILKNKFDISEFNFREVIIWNKNLKIIGMIDILSISIIEGKIIVKIIDHKVSRHDKYEYLSLQLNFYRLAIEDFIKSIGSHFNLPVHIELMGNIINKFKMSSSRMDIPILSNGDIIDMIEVSKLKFLTKSNHKFKSIDEKLK